LATSGDFFMATDSEGGLEAENHPRLVESDGARSA